MSAKAKRILSMIILAIPALMIVMSGVMKLSRAEELVTKLTQGGFGPYITLFGAIEVIAAVLLFIPKTFKIGFLLLSCYLGGALAVELSAGVFPTAAALLTVLWIGAYLRDKSLFVASAKA